MKSDVIVFLYRVRPLALLVALSAVLSVAYALTSLPLDFALGISPYWNAPSPVWFGDPPQGPHLASDSYVVLVGYTSLVLSPWGWPLLYAPFPGAPAGTNVFWMDAVPWLSLLGKLISSVLGFPVNLLGAFALACLVLPSVGMTVLLAAAGQRNLLAMMAGTVLAGTAPFLWYRWGQPALLAQFCIVLALAQYTADRSAGFNAGRWMGLLPLALLTNLYLFAMVGGIWVASLLQGVLDGDVAWRRMTRVAALTVGLVLAVMVPMGMLTPDLRSAGAGGFGYLAINLAGPFIPQLSGLVPGLEQYIAGVGYEGFSYLGFATLALLALSAGPMLKWLMGAWRRHAALLLVLSGMLAFAISNRVQIGSRLLFEVPLPEVVMRAAAVFRSSGRFFWPVGYALMAGALVIVLRRYRPAIAVPILVLLCVMQLIEHQPLRRAIATSASHENGGQAERRQIEDMVRRSNSVIVFPSWYCTEVAIGQGNIPYARRARMQLIDMYAQLAAANLRRPINSVYTARLSVDCDAERDAQAGTRTAGTLYIYLTDGPPPDRPGPGGEECGMIGEFRYCLSPVPSG